ncbi:MAG: DNA gyrase subunit A [Chloroflexi bacterium OLB14]|nr:MAG: DNA gyrase subunit A [Chloroflexi bacterium OLB14]
MSFTSKIDEWMKEVDERPESAATIVRLVVRRLRELSEQNEELLTENIALENGTRVEEYQKQITHLEYQLNMFKRRFRVDESTLASLPITEENASILNLLIYNAQGRVFRVELDEETKAVGSLSGEIVTDQEPPRLLTISSNETLLFLFTSGRVETFSASDIPTIEIGNTWTWEQATLVNEPHAGETLACIIPFSHLPLSDFFLQISRRGFTKKALTSISDSVLQNHFLGRGAIHKSDQPFNMTLANKNDLAAFVTYEGKVTAFDVEELSYTTIERIKLSATDYVIGAFLLPKNSSVLCITQNGKVIHRESNSIEILKSSNSKGQSLIPASRLEQGVRFMGAMAVKDTDQIAVLDATGKINIHQVREMTGNGSISAEDWILSIGLIQAEAGKKRSAS